MLPTGQREPEERASRDTLSPDGPAELYGIRSVGPKKMPLLLFPESWVSLYLSFVDASYLFPRTTSSLIWK